MTVRPLRLHEGNDELLLLAVTSAGMPYDVSGATVEMVIKASADVAADDEDVTVLSTATGEIAVTDGEDGEVVIRVAAEHLAEPGTRVYRVDVLDATGRRTVVHGDLTVTNL